jgi:hypothetical protein
VPEGAKVVKPTKGQIHKHKTKQVSPTPHLSASSSARTQRVEEDIEISAGQKRAINMVTRKKKPAPAEESPEEELSEVSSNDWPVSEELFNVMRRSKNKEKEREERSTKQVRVEDEKDKRERKKDRERREREKMEDIEKGKAALLRAMSKDLSSFESTSELEGDVEFERARKRRREDVGGSSARAGESGARAGESGARAGGSGARAGESGARAGESGARAGESGARAGESARISQPLSAHRSSPVSEACTEHEYSRQRALDMARMELQHEIGARQRLEEEMRTIREFNREQIDLRVSSARSEGEVVILKSALADAKESLREAKEAFRELDKTHASRETTLRRECAEQVKSMQENLIEKYASREDALRRDLEVENKRLLADVNEKERALSEANKRHHEEMVQLRTELELAKREKERLVSEGKESSARIDQLERDLDTFKRHSVDARKHD